MRSPLVWLRADLRTDDNPALWNAARVARDAQGSVEAAFVVCTEQWRDRHDWAPVKVHFLLRTLRVLGDDLAALGIRLHVLETPLFSGVGRMLLTLAESRGRDALFFNREYEVNEQRRDDAVAAMFTRSGRAVHAFHDQVLFPPGAILTGSGGPYTVFTPFKRRWRVEWNERAGVQPLDRPRAVGKPEQSPQIPARTKGYDWRPADTQGWQQLWPAGEHFARARLETFVGGRMQGYKDARDRPDVDGTSTLSPYLTIGAISARRCVHAAAESNGGRVDEGSAGAVGWIDELVWREFYRHVVAAFPRVCMGQPFRPEGRRIEWDDDPELFDAWAEGRTGYPIVDAAMRQLAETGWMHNRLRMVVASFLTKNLFLDWRLGERHFMRRLIDGDLASNNGGWQWSASVGTDAQPYFRVFSPVSQSERFDPDGIFIKSRLPELRGVPSEKLHDPVKQAGALKALAREYPSVVVDHSASRRRAIERLRAAFS